MMTESCRRTFIISLTESVAVLALECISSMLYGQYHSKAHDTRSRNRRHKSTPFFWRQFLVHVSCKSRTGFFWYQIRTVFYSKPESGVRVTEMMTCDWSVITVNVLRCREVVLCSSIICLFT